jgi:transposase
MCIYVREISVAEGNLLKKKMNSGKPVLWRRAQVVLLSAQGMKATDIAKTTFLHPDTVRDVIHAFNDEGMDSLEPKWGGGRPPEITKKQMAEIVEMAMTPPGAYGLPFTDWSLSKLKDNLITRGIVKSISIQTISRVLKAAGVSYQRTKTWKESNDPDFLRKKTA